MKQGSLISVEVEPEIDPTPESKAGPKPVFYDFNPKTFHDIVPEMKNRLLGK
jgi:hypothetical protein